MTITETNRGLALSVDVSNLRRELTAANAKIEALTADREAFRNHLVSLACCTEQLEVHISKHAVGPGSREEGQKIRGALNTLTTDAKTLLEADHPGASILAKLAEAAAQVALANQFKTNALERADKAEAALAASRLNERTAGTVEVCKSYQHYLCGDNPGKETTSCLAPRENCPMKAIRAQAKPEAATAGVNEP